MRKLSFLLSTSLLALPACDSGGGSGDTDSSDASTGDADPSTTDPATTDPSTDPSTTDPSTTGEDTETAGDDTTTDDGDTDTDDSDTETAGAVTFELRIEAVSEPSGVFGAGAFDTPEGADGPGPAFPGDSYEVSFGAAPGHYLSFATMFVQSNDFFIAPDPAGIPLFDEDGNPRIGDITDELLIWDAGTEEDEEPGTGPNQAPRQDGPDTGPDDDNPEIRLASDEFPDLPPITALVDASLSYDGEGVFTLTIENASTPTTLAFDGGATAVPLSPGAYAVHTTDVEFFELGGEASPGLEAMAEDGAAAGLADELGALVGLAVPLSPGAYVVHAEDAPFFTEGEADRGEGLEAIAEDGDPSGLVESVEGAVAFNTPDGADEPGPVFPGNAYAFQFDAEPGYAVSFATMFIQSNDLFYGPDSSGIALFDEDGNPRSGDITDEVTLWDAGTEDNQWPGAGPDQAPRQAGPDTGGGRSGNVRLVDDGFTYPADDQVIRVTLSVVE
ncbi:MAG: spondin domain-containing protein [Myxococcota bacterium]